MEFVLFIAAIMLGYAIHSYYHRKELSILKEQIYELHLKILESNWAVLETV